jgi:hypothetical protein
MKNKYQRMNKDEKKVLIEKFKTDEKRKEELNRLYIILFFGGILILFGIYSLFELIFIKYNTFNLVFMIISIVAGLFFVVAYYKLKIKILNKFSLKTKV